MRKKLREKYSVEDTTAMLRDALDVSLDNAGTNELDWLLFVDNEFELPKLQYFFENL